MIKDSEALSQFQIYSSDYVSSKPTVSFSNTLLVPYPQSTSRFIFRLSPSPSQLLAVQQYQRFEILRVQTRKKFSLKVLLCFFNRMLEKEPLPHLLLPTPRFLLRLGFCVVLGAQPYSCCNNSIYFILFSSSMDNYCFYQQFSNVTLKLQLSIQDTSVQI